MDRIIFDRGAIISRPLSGSASIAANVAGPGLVAGELIRHDGFIAEGRTSNGNVSIIRLSL